MENKYEFAKKLIRSAGQLIREKMERPLTVECKGRYDDLVTSLDKATQNYLIESIKEAYPDDQFFAEENGTTHPYDDGNVWIIDPIDGTVNFIVQSEDFAVMLAYFEEGVGQFGLIYDVMKDCLISGGPELPVERNGQSVQAYTTHCALNQTLLGTNSGMFASNYYGIADLAKETLGIRVIGSAGISMARVLNGEFIAYVSNIYPWDYAAAYVIGQALGYKVLTMDFEEPNFKDRQCVMILPELEIETFKQYIYKR